MLGNTLSEIKHIFSHNSFHISLLLMQMPLLSSKIKNLLFKGIHTPEIASHILLLLKGYKSAGTVSQFGRERSSLVAAAVRILSVT